MPFLYNFTNRSSEYRSRGSHMVPESSLVTTSGAAVFALTLFSVAFMTLCYQERVTKQERDLLKAEALRRERIRDAVRAKIAEMEGLEDSVSLRVYVEQREPVVKFGDVVEISPEQSEGVSVLYQLPCAFEGNCPLKRIDFSMEQLLGTTSSVSSSNVSSTAMPPVYLVPSAEAEGWHQAQLLWQNSH